MKRFLSLVSLVCLVTVLASAGGTQEPKATTPVQLTAPGTFPIVSEPATITLAVGVPASVEDMESNRHTLWYEEKTGVHVNWIQIPSSQWKERTNIMLAARDLPDAFTGQGSFSRAEVLLYADQGTIVSLDDAIASQSVHLLGLFESNPNIRNAITAPDGSIYTLPQIGEPYHPVYRQKMWINSIWMDELGLDMPTTTEEFYEVLRTFKTQDPNQTGRADEIPLAGTATGLTAVWPFLMNSFVYAHSGNLLILEDGQISYSPAEPGWREGLQYLKRLHDEGLLYSPSFGMDMAQLRQIGENPDAMILGAAGGMWQGNFSTAGGERWLHYVSVPPLAGPSGLRQSPQWDLPIVQPQMIVTADAQSPDLIVRWVDYFYTHEGGKQSQVGLWGEGMRRATPDEIGIDGRPAEWQLLEIWGAVHNIHWSGQIPWYDSNDMRMAQAGGPEELETILYHATVDYEASGVDKTLPPLFVSAEAAQEIGELETVLRDHVERSLAEFITGERRLDNAGWQAYLAELDRLGLANLLAAYQEAYDASAYAN